MARDYAKHHSGNSNKTRRQSTPAAKRKKQTATKGAGIPGWVWLFCGLCIGLVVAAGVYVFGRPAGNPGIQVSDVPAAVDPESSTQSDQDGDARKTEQSKDKKARFDFYKMLPNYEVVIPEEEYTRKGSGTDESESTTKAGQPASSTNKPQTAAKVDKPGRYIIQAGSFGEYNDADRRKANMALLGIEARIKEVELDDGRTVYRVHTKPIEGSDALNKALNKLRNNDIDTLVMRRNG